MGREPLGLGRRIQTIKIMLDLETIQILVGEALSLPKDQVISKGRRREIADARSLFIHFSHQQGHELIDIANHTNLQNSDAALYHVEKVDDLATRDTEMQKMYALCSEKIKSFKERQKS